MNRLTGYRACVLAESIANLAWGLQGDIGNGFNNDNETSKKFWAALELIRHAADTLADHLDTEKREATHV